MGADEGAAVRALFARRPDIEAGATLHLAADLFAAATAVLLHASALVAFSVAAIVFAPDDNV